MAVGARSRGAAAYRLAFLSATMLAMSPLAAEESSKAGHGSLALTYQLIHADGLEATTGFIPIGVTDTQTFNVEVEYYLSDKFSVVAGIPYVRKRYKGPVQHDPLLLDPPRPDVPNVDQGDWNSDFQDFHFGVRYSLRDGRFSIDTFALVDAPSNDYPFFGNAAVGQRLHKLELGSQFRWLPGLSNAYYRADVAYVFVEKTLGVNVNHWKLTGEVGYFLNDRLSGSVIAQFKDGPGLEFPDNFPPPRTDEKWYQHDRLVKHSYLNVGASMTWLINDRYALSGAYLTQAWGKVVHKMEYLLSVSITWMF